MNNVPRSSLASSREKLSTSVYLALIAAIGLVAFALRVVDLETIPAGLHFDQAANGLLALQVLAGQRPVFFPSYTGREALFMYVIAGLFQLLGPGTFALRLASALCGTATVIALAFLGSALFGRRVGLAASAFLAGLYWHLHVSRLAERTIMVPLLDVLALLALWHGFRRRSALVVALGGALVALQLYTYPSSRFFVVALLAIGVVELGLLVIRHVVGQRSGGKAIVDYLALAVIALLAAAVVIIPLASYFASNPSDLLGRADQVAIWNVGGDGPWLALATSVRSTLGMFFVLGDQDWKYNLAGQPVFDPVTAVLFTFGLVAALVAARDRAARICLIWGWCMLGPGFLSVDAPQFMRTLGAAPAAVLLAALGLGAIVQWLSRASAPLRRLAPALWGWPVLAGALTAYRYFAIWAPSPAAYLALEGDVTAAAAILRAESPKYAVTYVASRYGADPTLSFLVGDRLGPVRWFDGRAALPLPAPGAGRSLYVLPRTATDSYWYGALPAANLVATIVAPDHGPAVEAFALDSTVVLSRSNVTAIPSSAATDFSIARLVGTDVPAQARAGQTIAPTFIWQVESAPTAPVKFFVHLVDPSGQAWSQYDEEMYSTAEWEPGQLLLVRYPLKIPDDAALETYRLQVGLEHPDGSALASVATADHPPGTFWQSAPLTVSRAAKPPDLARLDVGRRMDVRFPDLLHLVGVEVPTTTIEDGDNVSVTFFWQVNGAVPLGIDTVVQVMNAAGQIVGQVIRPPDGGSWPSSDWQPGDVVVDREQLLIPAGTPPGQLTLTVSLRDTPNHPLIPIGQSRPGVRVASLVLQARPRVARSVAVTHPLAVAFQDPIRLVGYDLQPAAARPGESIQLRLYWQVDRPIDRGWTVFAHVLDAGNQIHAQEDSVPDHGGRPTTTWAPGETIVDLHTLVVQPGTPPGVEQIEIGLYDATTGARLPAVTGDDRILLDTPVTIRP